MGGNSIPGSLCSGGRRARNFIRHVPTVLEFEFGSDDVYCCSGCGICVGRDVAAQETTSSQSTAKQTWLDGTLKVIDVIDDAGVWLPCLNKTVVVRISVFEKLGHKN